MITNAFQSTLHPITSLAQSLLREPALLLNLHRYLFSSSSSTFGMVSTLVMRSAVVIVVITALSSNGLLRLAPNQVTFTSPYA